MTTTDSNSTEAVFRVRDLVRRFEEQTVLAGLDFDLLAGECLVVLGRSGSGKSVTLRQLNGLDRPDSGSIQFHGEETTSWSEREFYPLRRRVAMLFQDDALFDSMTVEENLSFPLREHTDLDEAARAEQIADALEQVGLGEIQDRLPAELSGGMKKRVALARSLMLKPEVLLFDEPTTGLDPITGATIRELIQKVQRNFTVTSIVVTHDVDLAREVGDRLAFLLDGQFRFLGTWDEAQSSDDRKLADFLAGKPEGHHAA